MEERLVLEGNLIPFAYSIIDDHGIVTSRGITLKLECTTEREASFKVAQAVLAKLRNKLYVLEGFSNVTVQAITLGFDMTTPKAGFSIHQDATVFIEPENGCYTCGLMEYFHDQIQNQLHANGLPNNCVISEHDEPLTEVVLNMPTVGKDGELSIIDSSLRLVLDASVPCCPGPRHPLEDELETIRKDLEGRLFTGVEGAGVDDVVFQLAGDSLVDKLNFLYDRYSEVTTAPIVDRVALVTPDGRFALIDNDNDTCTL